MASQPVQRFVNDDAGYLTWLAGHPSGWVLNTFPHVSSSYLVLHRAACRTVNRAPGAGRHWTVQYGKSCADDRAALESWAVRTTGKHVKPCGTCLPSEADRPFPGRSSKEARGPADGVRGPRTPRLSDVPIKYEGTPIRIVIRAPGLGTDEAGPSFAIEGAQWLAEFFFRRDPSAVGDGSYDSWIEGTQLDPARRDMIVDGDVLAVNRTMAARSSHAAWAEVVERDDWSWLRALDPAWDLLEIDDASWSREAIAARLADAFAATRRPKLGLAVITKVLHIKRPHLIPVLDSLVVEQIGARVNRNIETWVTAIERLREVGRANLEPLRLIQGHMEAKGLRHQSLVRIFDALLWASNPRAGLHASLRGWQQVLRPGDADEAP